MRRDRLVAEKRLNDTRKRWVILAPLALAGAGFWWTLRSTNDGPFRNQLRANLLTVYPDRKQYPGAELPFDDVDAVTGGVANR